MDIRPDVESLLSTSLDILKKTKSETIDHKAALAVLPEGNSSSAANGYAAVTRKSG